MSLPDSTRTCFTTCPSGPVWWVTSVLPSNAAAWALASSADLTTLTPLMLLSSMRVPSSATGVDLGFNDDDRRAQLFRYSFRFVSGLGNFAFRHRDTEPSENLFALELVYFLNQSLSVGCKLSRADLSRAARRDNLQIERLRGDWAIFESRVNKVS